MSIVGTNRMSLMRLDLDLFAAAGESTGGK
jgi:hypothetical protein